MNCVKFLPCIQKKYHFKIAKMTSLLHMHNSSFTLEDAEIVHFGFYTQLCVHHKEAGKNT